MRAISLQKNKFIGCLPEYIGIFLLLKAIGDNYFSGWLPMSMHKLVNCRYLDVSGNSVTRNSWLDCSYDKPGVLDLSNNNFTGEIWGSIGNLQLSKNQFVGSLPESPVNCINLKVLDVGQNLFTIFLRGFLSWLWSASPFLKTYTGSICQHPINLFKTWICRPMRYVVKFHLPLGISSVCSS